MKKSYILAALSALFLAVVAIVFFYPDDVEGNVLQQHDTMQGIANGQEGIAFHEATGETTRWTNSLFSGMPNFQIAPSYPAGKTLEWIGNAFGLWLPYPANLLFAMMAGFFILGLCFRLKWHTALFAAVAWGFSSYFIIIIGAGHIWKFITLAYIPPTIGGLILLYRGKYPAGIALTALFGALQLQGNHPQMSYYFGFVIVCFLLAWLYTAIRKHAVKRWLTATGCALFAGILAVGANSPSLYNTYEYSKETVRGKATELTVKGKTDTGGMDREAITAWSYGLDETFSILIPNVKGGATIKPTAGQNRFLSVEDTPQAQETYVQPELRPYMQQFAQYFGNQPMTNGPVYVGAFVLVLAIVALLTVEGPMKWALFAASILSLLLSWGHNFAPLTNFMIDNFPGYNKFRAVASALVILEFCVPLLAAMAVRKMYDTPDYASRYRMTFLAVAGGAALLCFIAWLSPSMFGTPFSQSEIDQLSEAGVFTNPQFAPLWDAIRQARLGLVSADALRSLIFIFLGTTVCVLWFRGIIRKPAVFACSLTLLVLIDLYPVGKRYVSTESFTTPVSNETALQMTDADRAILKDKGNYRVMDVGGFNDSRSSYFHKTIGGYHAAKLTRYNDLINRQILKSNPEVLNMLNAKYFLNGNDYEVNPGALGNAWFVDSIVYVSTPDEEMAALDSIKAGQWAVSDRKFASVLGNVPSVQLGDTIYETAYAPNRLTYKANSAKGGIAVFSEIYFPWGWKAEVDGKPVEIGRVDYVLRALKLAPGKHDITFTFDPESVRVTDTVSYASVALIYVACAVALLLWIIHICNPRTSRKEE